MYPQNSPRPYRPTDLPALLSLLSRRPPERTADFPSLVDLQEIADTPEGQAGLQVWENVLEELVGFSLLEENSLAFEISPAAPFEEVACQMVQASACSLQDSSDTSEQEQPALVLETACRDDNLQRLAFLEAQGFQRQAGRTLHFARSLRDPIPEPHLPHGFTLRPLAGESEVEAWVDLHRRAWGTEYMTIEYRLSMLRTPAYDPELDLVAVAPDGRLAAYVVVYFSPEENRLSGQQAGYTDPVATHPDFQRLGLSRALLLEGFSRLRQRGLDVARLSTSEENIAMVRTAESVGYRVVSATLFYALPLR